MSARDLCRLSGLARSSLYRKLKPASEHGQQLRQAIVQAASDHPAYGTRRTTHQVRRQKLNVNRKRVQRVMHEENLLRRNRRRAPQTTDSKHAPRRYENLTRDFRPEGSEPVVGLRYPLCAIEKPLRLCGRGVRRIFAAGGGLGRGFDYEN